MNDNLPTHEHRAQLAQLLKPQTEAEHQTVVYIAAVTKLQHSTLVELLQRRNRTTRRAERMALAQRVLAYWEPNMSASPTEVTDMEFLASGGDPSTGVVPEHEDVRTAVSLAYDRGFAEGWDEAVTRCRREVLAGRDPEVWRVERPGGEHR